MNKNFIKAVRGRGGSPFYETFFIKFCFFGGEGFPKSKQKIRVDYSNTERPRGKRREKLLSKRFVCLKIEKKLTKLSCITVGAVHSVH